MPLFFDSTNSKFFLIIILSVINVLDKKNRADTISIYHMKEYKEIVIGD